MTTATGTTAFTFACWLLLGVARAQEAPSATEQQRTGFFARTVVVGGDERRYVLFVPRGYTPNRVWPLVVFLNGMGECGTDGWKQTEVGLGPAIRADEARWPFLVAFPQKPDKESQWSEHGALVLGVVREVEATYYVDPVRRFLTGISQGGAGTWALGALHADLFAAIAPVCGYGKPNEVASKLKATPIWAFHGADDGVVPAQQSKALCAAVEAFGGSSVVLTLYANTAHNSWDRAYRESNLAEWLRLLPWESVLARALTTPEAMESFGLRFVLASGTGVETVELFSPRAGEWRRTVGHGSGSAQAGNDEGDALSPREGARGVADCVRLLVRAGITDVDCKTHPGHADGDYVEVDYSHGTGERRQSAWPKRFVVTEPLPPEVAAIRNAVAVLKQLK